MPPRNYSSYARRSRRPRLLVGGLSILALVSVGVVITLWVAGVPLNPYAGETAEDPFVVRIPINARPIPAYSRVEREHLINPSTGSLMFQKVPPPAAVGMSIVGVDQDGSHIESRVASVKNVDDKVVFVVPEGNEIPQSNTMTLGGAVLNINAILGRVVKKDKRAGLGFQESTFFPQGTPEGLAGATPTGMRSITLDANKLTGVHALNSGDRIDLIASFSGSEPDSKASSLLAELGGSGGGYDDRGSEPVLLAQNAIVLKPVYVRNEATTSTSLTEGKRVQNVPKYEVAIAVNEEDVIPLQRALNRKLTLTCVAHSMKPSDDGESLKMVSSPNEVRVPVTVRPILAYQVVTRDAFVSRATRTIQMETISRQQADRLGVVVELDEALGAIVRHDVAAGRYLRRGDLLKGPLDERVEEPTDDDSPLSQDHHAPHNLITNDGTRLVTWQETGADSSSPSSAIPVGDRPAVTRFIPAGRTAFAIPSSRIYGGEHLQIDDTIDLMASYSLERTLAEEETETRPDGTVIVRKSESLTPRTTQRTWEETFGNRAEPWFVATGALVVAPIGFPAPSAALRALSDRSGQSGNRSFEGPPVIIAVDDRDAEAVATSLATPDALFTIAFHSSATDRRSGSTKRIVVAPEPIEAFSMFDETSWNGNRRRLITRTVSVNNARYANALTMTEISAYYGRVLRKAKQRGEPFTAEDFLPKDTRAGMSAGVAPGYSLFPVADREIEGLDSFGRSDQVAIIHRSVLSDSAVDYRALFGEQPAVARLIVESVRIARPSTAGQTVLKIRNEDLTRLQAAIARSMHDRGSSQGRSHLIAVGLPRTRSAQDRSEVVSKIKSFDPTARLKTTEIIIGNQRRVEVYANGGAL